MSMTSLLEVFYPLMRLLPTSGSLADAQAAQRSRLFSNLGNARAHAFLSAPADTPHGARQRTEAAARDASLSYLYPSFGMRWVSIVLVSGHLMQPRRVELDVVVDGIQHTVEARNDETAKAAASRFCASKNLNDVDCARLADAIAATWEPRVPESREQPPNNRPVGVDYSRRVGPTLRVSYSSRDLELQKYAGETDEQAVARFCQGFKLAIDDCDQVRRSFACLAHGDCPPPVEPRVRRPRWHHGLFTLVLAALWLYCSQQQQQR